MWHKGATVVGHSLHAQRVRAVSGITGNAIPPAYQPIPTVYARAYYTTVVYHNVTCLSAGSLACRNNTVRFDISHMLHPGKQTFEAYQCWKTPLKTFEVFSFSPPPLFFVHSSVRHRTALQELRRHHLLAGYLALLRTKLLRRPAAGGRRGLCKVMRCRSFAVYLRLVVCICLFCFAQCEEEEEEENIPIGYPVIATIVNVIDSYLIFPGRIYFGAGDLHGTTTKRDKLKIKFTVTAVIQFLIHLLYLAIGGNARLILLEKIVGKVIVYYHMRLADDAASQRGHDMAMRRWHPEAYTGSASETMSLFCERNFLKVGMIVVASVVAGVAYYYSGEAMDSKWFKGASLLVAICSLAIGLLGGELIGENFCNGAVSPVVQG